MQHLIKRERLLAQARILVHESQVTVLLGARQTGKTTLAGIIAGANATLFDMEKATAQEALRTPEITLGECRGLVVLDEIQRMPELFTVLRPLADRVDNQARFLLLGSASLDLVKGVSESLAGRAMFLHVAGFAIDEVGVEHQNRLWIRGGFPRAYLAANEAAWARWIDGFITTFLERDIPQLGLRIPATSLRRFWNMLVHYHGQVLNLTELAYAMNVAPNTARHYLDILAGAYMVRVLPPWHENIGKRQIKTPKLYIRDTGLLHAFLGIDSLSALRSHPRYGASWEGFALEQVLIFFGEKDAYFWSTQRGAELDLLLLRNRRRIGFEFKCTDAPSMTRSIHVALEDLKPEALYVVYPGERRYRLHEKVEALPLSMLPDLYASVL
jgi:predicted AAA+ superfamily ATPase